MRRSRERGIVTAVLRCYPARWRQRHGEEATLIGSALLDDGVPWWSVTLNFLGGAARERIMRKPSMRLGTTLAAFAVFVAAVPLALFASLDSASASSVNVVIVISNPNDAARQLESAFSAHHFKVTVTEKLAPTTLAGSILSVLTEGAPRASADGIKELRGLCVGGSSGCIDELVLPRNFSGTAHVTIGTTATRKAFDVRIRAR
jgi:hypothetical protein